MENNSSVLKLINQLNTNIANSYKNKLLKEYSQFYFNNPDINVDINKMMIWCVLLSNQKSIHFDSDVKRTNNEWVVGLSTEDLIVYYKHFIKKYKSLNESLQFQNYYESFRHLINNKFSKDNAWSSALKNCLRFILIMCDEQQLVNNMSTQSSINLQINNTIWLENKIRPTSILPVYCQTDMNLMGLPSNLNEDSSILNMYDHRINQNRILMYGTSYNNDEFTKTLHNQNKQMHNEKCHSAQKNIKDNKSWDYYTKSKYSKTYLSESGPLLYDLINDHHHKINYDFYQKIKITTTHTKTPSTDSLDARYSAQYSRISAQQFIKNCIYCCIGVESVCFSKNEENHLMIPDKNVTCTGISITTIQKYLLLFSDVGSIYIQLVKMLNQLNPMTYSINGRSNKQPTCCCLYASSLGIYQALKTLLHIYRESINKIFDENLTNLLLCYQNIFNVSRLIRFTDNVIMNLLTNSNIHNLNFSVIDEIVKINDKSNFEWQSNCLLLIVDNILKYLFGYINNWLFNGRLPENNSSFFIQFVKMTPMYLNNNILLFDQYQINPNNSSPNFLQKYCQHIFNCGYSSKIISLIDNKSELCSLYAGVNMHESVIIEQTNLNEKLTNLMNPKLHEMSEFQQQTSKTSSITPLPNDNFKFFKGIDDYNNKVFSGISNVLSNEFSTNLKDHQHNHNQSNIVELYLALLEDSIFKTNYLIEKINWKFLDNHFNIKSYLCDFFDLHLLNNIRFSNCFTDKIIKSMNNSILNVLSKNIVSTFFHEALIYSFPSIKTVNNKLCPTDFQWTFNSINDDGNDNLMNFNVDLNWKQQLPYILIISSKLTARLNQVFNILIKMLTRLQILIYTFYYSNKNQTLKNSSFNCQSKQHHDSVNGFMLVNYYIDLLSMVERYLKKNIHDLKVNIKNSNSISSLFDAVELFSLNSLSKLYIFDESYDQMKNFSNDGITSKLMNDFQVPYNRILKSIDMFILLRHTTAMTSSETYKSHLIDINNIRHFVNGYLN